jgi:hypothetical protein
VPLEPAIFRELALTGKWDQERFLELIRAQAFAFVIMENDPELIAQRYTPDELAAIALAYPRVEIRGRYVIRYPGGS